VDICPLLFVVGGSTRSLLARFLAPPLFCPAFCLSLLPSLPLSLFGSDHSALPRSCDTLGGLACWQRVNIEVDLLARYAAAAVEI